MNSACDFDLLGELVPQVQVWVCTLAHLGFSLSYICVYIYELYHEAEWDMGCYARFLSLSPEAEGQGR